MKTLIVIALLVAVLVWYVSCGRAWLKSKRWAAGFFAWIEPVEITLYKKSETILWARFKIIVGALLTFLTQIGTIDITPIMPFVPERYQGMARALFGLLPLTVSLMGMLDEKLRNATTKPIEVVAAPSTSPAAVAANIAVEQTNAEAVATVEAAKV